MALESAVAAAIGHAISHQPGTAERKSAASPAAARCEVCGNTYAAPIEVHARGQKRVFDCFECAIHALAPLCAHCQCRIIGHGVEVDGIIFCCAHCARAAGVSVSA